jgi:hypothetical protein
VGGRPFYLAERKCDVGKTNPRPTILDKGVFVFLLILVALVAFKLRVFG